MYKILLKILVAVVLIIFLGLLSLDPILKSFVPEYENKDNCLSKGTLQLICNLQNPEDFAEIPGEDALIISQFAGLAELNEGSIKTGLLSRLDLGILRGIILVNLRNTNKLPDFTKHVSCKRSHL